LAAQKYVAQIYYENLLDYNQAILEYEKLLRLPGKPQEKASYQMTVAKAQYQLGNLGQALAELDAILKKSPEPDMAYSAQVLKSEILISQKKYDDAATVLEATVKQFPKRSKQQNLAFSLVVCYEDLKNFAKAIEILEKMKQDYTHPKFIENRINRLKERIANLPAGERKSH
jgi:TolA-binding protein